MRNKISKIFLSVFTAAILLVSCNVNNNSVSNKGNVNFSCNVTGTFGQVKNNSRAAETITGQLTATNLDLATSEVFNWYSTIDEETFTLTSNKSIILQPGNYEFSMTLIKGNFQYAGSTAVTTIIDGENNINLTIQPVVGDIDTSISLTETASMKFKYPAIELENITDPKIGYTIDGNNEVIVNINKTSGLSEVYINLTPATYNMKLKLYDGNLQIGKSVNSQENITVSQTQDIHMDIIPLHGETAFNLVYNGGDAVINFIIPPEVIEEAGGISDLQTIMRLNSSVNGNKEEVISLSLDTATGNYTGSITLNNFYYDIVSMSLTFIDITDNFQIGNCAVSNIQFNKDSQLIDFNLEIYRRSVISGNLLSVLGINVFNDKDEAVSGVEIYVNNVLSGITGSQTFGTAGYLKLYLPKNTYEIKAETVSQIGSENIIVNQLENNNINITLADKPIETPTAILSWGCGNAAQKTFPESGTSLTTDTSNAIFSLNNITPRDDNRHFFNVQNQNSVLDISTAPYLSYSFNINNQLQLDRMVVHGNTERSFILELRSSIDNFSTSLGNFAPASTYYQYSSIDISSLNLPSSGSVEFRIYIYNTTGTGDNLLSLSGGTYFESADGTPSAYNTITASVSFWK